MEPILDRFLRYAAVETTSCEESGSKPSATGELELARMLARELQEMGASGAGVDGQGYVMARIPASKGLEDAPAVGLIAHMDTSPDAPGKCLDPQIIKNYDGSDIALRAVPGLSIRTKDFPELKQYKGQTIITTDGTTLLGADDKAGIAEIMWVAEFFLSNPDIPHGALCIAFTPDEEIGRGADGFDIEKFGAAFAYTIDGGALGEIEYENFNAARARIHIQGRNVHPGYAKDRMINALHIATEFNSLLPAGERPEYTEGHEGFYHLTDLNGTVAEADMEYIIRDHDRKKFEQRKSAVSHAAEIINRKYEDIVTLEMKDQYYNMMEAIKPHFQIVEKAIKAVEMAGIQPKVQPVRGGTDGAMLSQKGLPCPNLFTGGHNFHGVTEFVPLESMEKATQVIINLIQLFTK